VAKSATTAIASQLRFALAKFRPTTLPATLVTRSVLHDRLTAGASRRLTVVVGSAGAGKSVLLSSWAAARAPGVTSWLSCDEADANPARFWAGFIEAFTEQLVAAALQVRAAQPDVRRSGRGLAVSGSASNEDPAQATATARLSREGMPVPLDLPAGACRCRDGQASLDLPAPNTRPLTHRPGDPPLVVEMARDSSTM